MRRARQFYGETLDLEQLSEMGADVVTYRTGKTQLVVYRSPDNAGTNRANAVVRDVGKDFPKIVDALRSTGVRFLHYPDCRASRSKATCIARARISWCGLPTRTATFYTSTISRLASFAAWCRDVHR
jgi:hypothetical protein